MGSAGWRLVAISRNGIVSRWRMAIASPGSGSSTARLLAHLGLDRVDDPLGLLLLAVDEQPARALRHVPAHEQDGEAEDRAEAEGEPPAEVRGEDRGVEQQQRRRAHRSPRRPSSCR